MTTENGRAQPDKRPDGNGNFSERTIASLTKRTERFRRMTNVKGRPMTYGARAKDR